uniref:Uncharacterized protein n=1 Tax=Setaria italica TaxID=4555 RepID=K3ZPT5_SETIT
MRIITGKITIEHYHFHPSTDILKHILLTPEARKYSEMEGIFIQPLFASDCLFFSFRSLSDEMASILC